MAKKKKTTEAVETEAVETEAEAPTKTRRRGPRKSTWKVTYAGLVTAAAMAELEGEGSILEHLKDEQGNAVRLPAQEDIDAEIKSMEKIFALISRLKG